jgi:hypothetical protein
MPGDYNCLVEVYEGLGGIVKESGGKPGLGRFRLEAKMFAYNFAYTQKLLTPSLDLGPRLATGLK